MDGVVFNNLEQATSTDLMNVQKMRERSIAEVLRELLGTRSYAASAAYPAEASSDVVVGGLELSPNGNNVFVGPGVLVQDSSSLLPVPGDLDSTYRIGRNPEPASVTLAAPGSDTYYLVEARMKENITSTESRPIWNTVTKQFDPTNVTKRKEQEIEFQVVAGASGNFPAPSGAPWIPIGGVLRPSGGGAVSADHLFDMRRLPRRAYTSVDDGTFRRNHFVPGTPTSASVSGVMHLDIEGFWRGHHLFIRTPPGEPLVLNHANISEVVYSQSTTNPGNMWHYLYLVPWNDLACTGQMMPTWNGSSVVLKKIHQRGALVMSNVAPTLGRKTNSAAITMPKPFGNAVVAAGDAVCVAALLNGVTTIIFGGGDPNQYYITFGNPQVSSNGHVSVESQISLFDIDLPTPDTYVTVTYASLSRKPPTSARSLLLEMSAEADAAAGEFASLDWGEWSMSNGDEFSRRKWVDHLQTPVPIRGRSEIIDFVEARLVEWIE